MKKIYIGMNDDLPNASASFEVIKNKLKNNIDNAIVVNSSSFMFEYPALQRIWQDSQSEDFFGLYIHCKGASKIDIDQLQNGLAWLEYMLYGLVDNMDLCIDHLTRGADLVGSMWYRHFKGNCFWFRSDYVRGLMSPMSMDTTNRYHAEYWCAQNYWWGGYKYPKVKNLFYIPLNSDNDFLQLKRSGYVPDLNEESVCNDIQAAITSNNYTIFNNINISLSDYNKYNNEIIKFSNYDSNIKIQ